MNVAFMGMGYHFGVTKSTDFFINLLREAFPGMVHFPHEETWLYLSPRKKWDVLICLQHIPAVWELEAIGARSVVLIPMFDACPKDEAFWAPYKNYKVVAFSSTLGSLLRGWGHSVHTVHYFTPVPEKSVVWDGNLRGFFWPRRPELTWQHIRPLLDGATWSRFHLHLTEATAVPTEPEAQEFQVQTSRWFEKPEEYQETLVQHNVFFSPRRYEGIGMAYLEAMALGMAVVSPDHPTMNEIITSGVNGLLFDPDHPTTIDWTQAEAWGRAARQTAIKGRLQWESGIPTLVDFLKPEPGVVVPARRHRWRRTRATWSVRIEYVLRAIFRSVKAILRKALQKSAN